VNKNKLFSNFKFN